jgi:hypothetical protein
VDDLLAGGRTGQAASGAGSLERLVTEAMEINTAQR